MHRRIKNFVKSLVPASIVTFRLPGDCGKSILLTFDDGPSSKFTGPVLDLLDANNAKAIFFMPGQRAEKNPDIVREVVARGHMVGNHSFSHPIGRLPLPQWVEEMQRGQNALFNITGKYPTYFRPVQGIITLPILMAAWRCNLRIMHWSFDTGDYSYLSGADVEFLAENFTRQFLNRTIVLAHDDHSVVPDLLKIALPQLKSQGYNLEVGLSKLVDHHQSESFHFD